MVKRILLTAITGFNTHHRSASDGHSLPVSGSHDFLQPESGGLRWATLRSLRTVAALKIGSSLNDPHRIRGGLPKPTRIRSAASLS